MYVFLVFFSGHLTFTRLYVLVVADKLGFEHRAMTMDGFTDASELIRPGVYVLLSQGKVVFVGKGERSMLAKIAAHRDLARKRAPVWLPIKGIVFDQVFIKYVHPDHLDEVYEDLIAEHSPRHNTIFPLYIPHSPAPQTFRRP